MNRRRLALLSSWLENIRLLALGLVAVYLVALLTGHRGPLLWRDFGLQVSAFLCIALYATGRAVIDVTNRSWVMPVAGWMWIMTIGNTLANGVEWGRTTSATSASSIVFVMAFPFGLTAVVRLNQGLWRPSTTDQFFEAAVSTLAIGSVFLSLIVPQALEATDGDAWATVVTLNYPLLDLVLVMLVARSVSLSTLDSRRMSGWMMVGLLLFASVDSIYAVGASSGSWEIGHPIDAVWVLGSVAVGLMAPADRGSYGVSRLWELSATAVPSVAAMAGVLVLAVGNWAQLPAAGSVMAAACVIVALARFVTLNTEMYRMLDSYRQARTDELTGLANRRRMYEALDEALSARDRDYALLMIDLNRFKEVNDRFGHAAGDDVLWGVAQCLKDVMPEDSTVGRVGGDEFAVITPVDWERPVTDLAWSLSDAVGAIPTPAGPIIGASIGVAMALGGARIDRTELLRQADSAMYHAKRLGLTVHCSDEHRVALDSSPCHQQAEAVDRRARLEITVMSEVGE